MKTKTASPSLSLVKQTALAALATMACSFSISAHAGFDESYKALQAKDYPTAMAEARKAADAGDGRGALLMGIIYQNGYGVAASPQEAFAWYDKAANSRIIGAFPKLAWAYLKGDGVAKDSAKALGYARLGAAADDAESAFLVYLAITNNQLGFIDATGRPDIAKYNKLAARPLEQRALDTEGYDALYRSAAKGYPTAVMMLASFLGGTLGEGNLQKMHALAAAIPADKFPAVDTYEKISRQMSALGQTNTTPQLFRDTYMSQAMAAQAKACGMTKTDAADDAKKEATDAKEAPPQLTSLSISKPLSNAVYLPSKVPGYEHANMIAGSWEEEWKYTACGKNVAVNVLFTADGFGGANYSSRLQGKAAQ